MCIRQELDAQNQVILLHESGAVTEGYLIFRNPFLPSYQIVL